LGYEKRGFLGGGNSQEKMFRSHKKASFEDIEQTLNLIGGIDFSIFPETPPPV